MRTRTVCEAIAVLLPAFVDHETSVDEAARVEAHLQTCPACRAQVKRYEQLNSELDTGIRAALHEAPARLPEHRRVLTHGADNGLGFGPLRLASGLLVIVILGAFAAFVLLRTAPSPSAVQTAAQPTRPADPPVVVASVSGFIDPGIAAYVQRALRTAESRQTALVLVLDSPGGQPAAIDSIANSLANSEAPTVAYVWPSGARLASDASSIVGAADVVGLAPGATGVEASETQQAPGLRQLLDAIDGRAVQTRSGHVTLATAGVSMRPLEMETLELLVHRLADPTLVYLLFVLGLLAILFELSQPGGLVLGAVGVLAAALATVALVTTLPVNWLGVALLLGAMCLFAVELYLTTHGAATLVGVGALVAGSLLLYTPSEIAVAPPLLIGMSGAGGLFGLWLARVAARVGLQPPLQAAEDVEGADGIARTALEPDGVVYVQGQLWSARLRAGRLDAGESIRVVRRRGLVLDVESATFRGAATLKGASR